jgi:hypothetical protein
MYLVYTLLICFFFKLVSVYLVLLPVTRLLMPPSECTPCLSHSILTDILYKLVLVYLVLVIDI